MSDEGGTQPTKSTGASGPAARAGEQRTSKDAELLAGCDARTWLVDMVFARGAPFAPHSARARYQVLSSDLSAAKLSVLAHSELAERWLIAVKPPPAQEPVFGSTQLDNHLFPPAGS
jgi:hypothetical protein